MSEALQVLEIAKKDKARALDIAHKTSQSTYSPVDVSQFDFDDGSVLICKNSAGEYSEKDFEIL